VAEPVAGLGALIDALVRAHRAAAPPPRGLPYLGLEQASGTAVHLLDGLSTAGIFRKYELVLDLDAGLGATARWLAARLGCDVVAAVASPDEASAARELTRRAGLAGQVGVVPAAANRLPIRSGRVTHVWAVEALGRMAAPEEALGEAFRALRRGGMIAVQELVAPGRTSVEIAGWRRSPLNVWLAALERAGFVEVVARDRTAEALETSAQVLAARARLLGELQRVPALASLARERERLAEALAARTLTVAQIAARRP